MIGMGKGLLTTFAHLTRPAITGMYPDVKPSLPERSRMAFRLVLGDDGKPVCKACQACAKGCPEEAVSITSDKPPEGGPPQLRGFQIDLGRCMFCGLCVEGCPSKSLAHTGDFELTAFERGGTIAVLYESAGGESPPHAADAEPGDDGEGATP